MRQVLQMFGDYHVHLDKLEWSLRTIEQMCLKGREEGVDTLGVLLHTKILQGFEPLYEHVLSDGLRHRKLVFDKSLDEFIEILQNAKDRGYPVKAGLEVCYSPEGEEFLRQKLKEYPLDYTVGSVHLIGSMHFKTAAEVYRDKKAVGEEYYNLVLKAAESKLFNIIGHMEIARREGIPGLDSYPHLQRSICGALALNNCAVEINTKCLAKQGRLFPDKGTLEYMAGRGIKLAFGSDAHHKSRIGFGKELAYLVIRDAGFEGFSM